MTNILIRVIGAVFIALVLDELFGLRRHVQRFELRGNAPHGYYWVFQIVSFVGLLIAATLARRNMRAIGFALIGILAGYCFSFVVFHLLWIYSAGASVAADLFAPVILLGPVMEGITFLTYLMLVGLRLPLKTGQV